MPGLDVKENDPVTGQNMTNLLDHAAECSSALQTADFFEHAPDPFLITDQHGTILAVNSAATNLLGNSRETLHRRSFASFVAPTDQQTISQFLSDPQLPGEQTLHLINDRNELITAKIHISGRKSERSGKKLLFWTIRRQTEEFKEDDIFKMFFDRSPDAIAFLDQGKIIKCNTVFVSELGFTSEKQLLFHYPADFSPPNQPDGRPSRDKNLEMIEQAKAKHSHRFEWVLRRADGTDFPVEVSLTDMSVSGKELSFAIWRDITDRKLAQQRLERERSFLRTVIDSVPGFVGVKDRNGVFLLANRSFAQAYGTTVEEMTGKTDADFNPNRDEVDKFRRDDLEVMDTCRPKYIPEERITDAHGIKQWLSTYKIPLFDGNNRCDHVLVVTNYITDRKLIEDELKKLNTDLERRIQERTAELTRSNTELARFAYVASHDLQEPLRMIASYVRLLEMRYHDKLDDDARDFIGYAVEGATRMQNMIKGLLDYSQIGREPLALQPVDCEEIFLQAVHELRHRIRDLDAAITHTPLPTVLGNPTLILRVFQNLLDNAVKFKKENVTPDIHVSAEKKDAEWIFCVRDNGIGIDPAYFDRLFGIYQRLHPRGRIPGTGLGLAIVKRIVEHHGGRVWIDSKINEGASVYFSLPIRNPENV